jgi:glycosyltransferase involved in cell wall biosynthesis/SAM-dependent methyltransferase
MKLAYFSPLNPRRSGISDYSEALLPYLGKRADIDIFVEDYRPENQEIAQLFPVRQWQEFECSQYDAVLYQMGNNPYHVYIRDLALRVPGVMVLHEFNLHYLAADSTVLRNDWDTYLRELESEGGSDAVAHANRARTGEVTLEFDRFAMNRSLIEASQGLIVHSHYVERLVQEAGHNARIAVIPHGVARPTADRDAARRRLELNGQPLFGAFGFLKHYKRIKSIIQAFARLTRYRPEARLILVGEEHPHYPLRPLIRDLGQEERIRILGHVPLDEFVEYMAACDVCLNLRYPTAGETSGSLLREMALARPVIVSDIGAFSELPEDTCIKVPAGPESSVSEPEWLFEYMNALVNRPDLAQSMGANAASYVARECSWETVAERYMEFLRSFMQLRPDTVAAVKGEAAPGHASNSDRIAQCILDASKAAPHSENYARTHLRRFVKTLELTPRGGPGKSILEMGCYMQMTPALRLFLDYEDVRGCYFGPIGRSDWKTVQLPGGEFGCFVDLFDAEKDIYPYPDASFDTVLCCELLEHLFNDPMHMMSELNRILKPGGHLVLTTPNITSYYSLHAVLLAWHPGFFHTYVKPNPDGSFDPRHNREFAPRDMHVMFPAAGFKVEHMETDWYAEPDGDYAGRVREMRELLQQRNLSLELREDCLYTIGRKTGPVVSRWPRGLYEL